PVHDVGQKRVCQPDFYDVLGRLDPTSTLRHRRHGRRRDWTRFQPRTPSPLRALRAEGNPQRKPAPKPSPDLLALWGVWLQSVGRHVTEQEAFHEDSYVPRCGKPGCAWKHGAVERELVADVHPPGARLTQVDLTHLLLEENPFSFETVHLCACNCGYSSTRCTARAFGPGRVLALRVNRPRGQESALDTPLTLRLKGRDFHLRATVCRLGKSEESGHYMTFVPLDKGERWLSYNDSDVQVCAPPPLNRTRSRLLFYEAVECAGVLPAPRGGPEDRLPAGSRSNTTADTELDESSRGPSAENIRSRD
ncbi:unnamed protein product, partial [Effrenium voratum]